MSEYIEREEALAECDWYANEFCEAEYAIMPIRSAIRNIPSADVVPVRHGRWYRFQKVYIDPQSGCGFGRDMYKCDVCNVGEEETRTPYCPNCGALMDKEEN